jgi:hypothetical protein
LHQKLHEDNLALAKQLNSKTREVVKITLFYSLQSEGVK